MKFEVEAKDGEARAGFMETAHGQVPTPCFMPVGTYGSVKAAHPAHLADLGARMILCNAYHLYLSPGLSTVRACGGIQRFIGWDGPVLTDSGGYQVFSLRELLRVDDQGVECRSPLDGSRHFLTPELMVDFQAGLGVDVAMSLDHCVPADAGRVDVEDALRRTTAWAKRGLDVDRLSETALFGIVQGGVHRDLRKSHLEELAAMAFDGLALGGFSVGEPPQTMYEMVDWLAPQMPDSKPRYLMGVGRPQDIVRAVRSGMDLFDCVMPTRHARNGQLFTTRGPVNIANARHRDDPAPVDEGCGCPTCGRFSRAYLSHLYRRKEILYHQLATTHNLHHYLELMRRIRDAVRSETLEDLVEEVDQQAEAPG